MEPDSTTKAPGATERDARRDAPVSVLGRFAAAWGVGGVLALLARAIWSLMPVALRAFETPDPLPVSHGILVALWVAFMCHAEGYRGIQRTLGPRVVVRAAHLARNPRPSHVVLAPLYCMGLVHATRPRRLRSWAFVVGMVALVALVRLVPQPWRGYVDTGVVAGLGWGVAAIAGLSARARAGRPPGPPLGLPPD